MGFKSSIKYKTSTESILFSDSVASMSISNILIKNLPKDVVEKIGRFIFGYSTPILGLISADPTITPIQLGSATFVQYGAEKGLLTAQHVIKNTDYHLCEYIGLVVSDKEHRFVIPREYLIESLLNPKSPEYGPDLAFIRIPDLKASEISARRSFWNMESNLKAVPKIISLSERWGMWIISGCPSAYQSIEPSNSHFDNTFILGGLVAMSEKPTYTDKGVHDYYDFMACYEEGNDLPETFGGLSGGGVWYIPLSKQNDSSKIQAGIPSLMGTAFYQTSLQDDSRVIRCHGHKSIFIEMQKMLDSIK